MRIDQSAFNEIRNLQGVKGLLLVSREGKILFKDLKAALPGEIETWDWTDFVGSIHGLREVDMAFDTGHLYLRSSDAGYLVVVAGSEVPIALLRLNCDILLPALKQTKRTATGIKRFFKK